jgi:hypothetical protein
MPLLNRDSARGTAVSKADVLMMGSMLPIVTETLADRVHVHRLWEAADRAALMREVGPRIRGVATSPGHGRFDATLMDTLPKLEIIASFGVGYDHVDAAEAARRGIIVTNTPDVLNDEVADTALGLLLATVRQLPQADRYVREGRWLDKNFPLTATLRERKAGILGLGGSARPSPSGWKPSGSRLRIMAAAGNRTSPIPTIRPWSASRKPSMFSSSSRPAERRPRTSSTRRCCGRSDPTAS